MYDDLLRKMGNSKKNVQFSSEKRNSFSVLKHDGLLIVLIIFSYCFWLNFKFWNNPNNKRLNVVELIKSFGYPVEIHQVISDGYILTLHRIPHGQNPRNSNETNRIPVLLVHGFINSAAQFINLGPQKALSFLLADKNYDIWLANVRGSTWSRKHIKLDPDKDRKKFWDYNCDDLSLNDLPATIDYILNKTSQNQLHYVGYSQGAIFYFIMASEKPEYMQKIRLMTAIAPAVFISNAKGLLNRFLANYPKFIETLFYYLDIHEFFSIDGYVASITNIICDENSIFVNLCLHKIFATQGYNYEQLNKTLLTRIYANLPAGVSVKQFTHLNQFIATGRFSRYDHGSKENLIKYGQTDPPLYNLTKATVPTAIYYAANDWLVQIQDVERLIKNLPNVVKTYLVPNENFTHSDLIQGTDADKLLYHSIIEEIKKY